MSCCVKRSPIRFNTLVKFISDTTEANNIKDVSGAYVSIPREQVEAIEVYGEVKTLSKGNSIINNINDRIEESVIQVTVRWFDYVALKIDIKTGKIKCLSQTLKINKILDLDLEKKTLIFYCSSIKVN